MAKKATTTEVAVINIKGLEVLESLKAEIDTQANNCLQIKVMDDSTLAVCQQNLSKINQLVKTIDAKRKELKDPYFQAGKQIDATANMLVEAAEKAIEHLKLEVKNWELKKQEEAKAAQAALEAQAKEAQEKADAEANRIAAIRSNIEKARTVLQSMYNHCTDVAKCDAAITNIESGYKKREEFAEFADEAYNLKDNYIGLIKAKKTQLEGAASMSEEEKAIIQAKEEITRQKVELDAKESQLKAQMDALEAEKARKAEEERLKLEQEKIQAAAEADKTRGVRHIWKTELVDKSKLISDWIAVDEKAVKEYLSANKETIKDGEVINGIKFYKEISISA